MYVDLSKLPTPNSVYSTSLSALYGGLNVNKTAYDVRPNQCSDMQNMIWHDGVLRGRPGLEQIGSPDAEHPNDETRKPFAPLPNGVSADNVVTLSAFSETWHDRMFFQTNVGLYYVDMRTAATSAQPYVLLQRLYDVNEGRGSWFHWLESLYFKGKNCYYKIDYEENGGVESVTCEQVVGYIPVIQINTKRDGVGDLWQPENRLSAYKEVWFDADPGVSIVEIPCDGVTTSFHLNDHINWKYENGYTLSARTNVEGTSATIDGAVFLYKDYFTKFGAVPYKLVATVTDGVPVWFVYIINVSEDGEWKAVGAVNNAHLTQDFGIRLTGFSEFHTGDTIYIDVQKKADAAFPQEVSSLFVGATELILGTDYEINDDNPNNIIVQMIGAEDSGSYIHKYGIPDVGLKWTVKYKTAATVYHLPLTALDSIDSVSVNGIVYTEANSPVNMTSTEYFPDKEQGTITFADNLGIYGAATYNANLIKVVYGKSNQDAQNAFWNCTLAHVFGGSGIEENVIVMSGIIAQPNAFIWSGNDLYGSNPAYFPIENYNLVGEYYDKITGFGRQQDKLVIFQNNRVSAATFSTDTIDERTVIRLNVKAINAVIGCDRPGSIQLCDNNLVWANSKYGICYLKDSTYAYETLVEPISQNIDRKLKEDLVADERLSSADYDGKYWLFVNGDAYVWDYGVQPYTADHEKLCWYWMTEFASAAATLHGTEIFFLNDTRRLEAIHDEDSGSRIYVFGMSYDRYKDIPVRSPHAEGEEYDVVPRPISRHFTPQLQLFGGFDRLKDVRKAIFSMPASRPIKAEVIYNTDYADRNDKTDIDNEYEFLNWDDRSVSLSAVRVRKPKCRHIHQFEVSFECRDPDADLAIDSIQLFYTYGERTKSGVRM